MSGRTKMQAAPDPGPMVYPMRCLRCGRVHDAAKVTPVQRYTDCTTWKCPNCRALIDDRHPAAGGSAIRVADERDPFDPMEMTPWR